MPKPFPQEFGEDIIAVARDRGHGVTLKQIAADFDVNVATLQTWLKHVS